MSITISRTHGHAKCDRHTRTSGWLMIASSMASGCPYFVGALGSHESPASTIMGRSYFRHSSNSGSMQSSVIQKRCFAGWSESPRAPKPAKALSNASGASGRCGSTLAKATKRSGWSLTMLATCSFVAIQPPAVVVRSSGSSTLFSIPP